MIDPRSAIIGALIALAGNAAYAHDTWRGRTSPNRVSWALWALAPLVAFAAELKQHVGVQAVLTLSLGLGPLLVLVVSLRDSAAYDRVTPVDALCGVFSLLALLLWSLTGAGDVAIALSVTADLFGAIPTYRKAYRAPQSETAAAFAAGSVAGAIGLLAIRPANWGFASAAFPTYILCSGLLITLLICSPKRRSARANHAATDPAQSRQLEP